jgi:cation transporter-like permease
VYTLANVLAAHAVGVAAVWWLFSPNTVLVNVVATLLLALTVLWMRLVVARRDRRLASDFEDLTPNLITHGGMGPARWDRRSRRQRRGGPSPRHCEEVP